MFDTVAGSGWCCVDCLMWLANGETDPEWSDEKRAEWLKNFGERNDGVEITLGMLRERHECADENGDTAFDRDDDCECERQAFSWSQCDTCGSNLGGERQAVTFWK